jgi:hypothetical protein
MRRTEGRFGRELARPRGEVIARYASTDREQTAALGGRSCRLGRYIQHGNCPNSGTERESQFWS